VGEGEAILLGLRTPGPSSRRARRHASTVSVPVGVHRTASRHVGPRLRACPGPFYSLARGCVPGMLRRDRERWGMRECQAARRIGVSVREYRELEAGTRSPTFETWDRIYELYGLAADVRGRDVSLRAP
jgi:hypothetical protein